MSLINKVKNFFYEDVEEDVEDTVQEEKKKFNFFKKEPKVEGKEEINIEPVDVKQEANNDLSERELFKAERTFNFPMDLGDEIFDNEEEKEEVKVETPVRREPVKQETFTRSIYHNISREEPKQEEKKKFRPSPVISPVYGILDKNYTVDDVVDVDKTKEFSLDKKIVDYDTVRNRAYKDVDEELDKTMNNDIFYNLDEEDNNQEDDFHTEEPSVIITYDEEEPIKIEAEEVEFKEEPVKIEEKEVEEPINNEIESEEDEDISPDVKIETPVKKKNKKEEKKEEKEDLFNLIDNMYNEDEEEDDE